MNDDLAEIRKLLHELDQAFLLVKEERPEYLSRKSLVKRVIHILDRACQDIVADPDNHILGSPAPRKTHDEDDQPKSELQES